MTIDIIQRQVKNVCMNFPSLRAIAELLKPITWFPPMWAYACGVISSGVPLEGHGLRTLGGIVLAGPMVCACSQACNDWFDRHVDAINEPHRPIPSGRMPGYWGLGLALVWTALSLLWAWCLGTWACWAAALGLALAWAYSAPPLRLKQNGWLGNSACALSYEGLAWLTGAAVMLGHNFPNDSVLVLALLYSVGAHGIMTLNDFKAIEGDRVMNIRSLPVLMGPRGAAWMASLIMTLAQWSVALVLLRAHQDLSAGAVFLLSLAQWPLMARFVLDPVGKALAVSAMGVPLYVTGMMVSAFALRSMA
jgi:chlorophyll/bacteriochlorophyll a synthase